LKVINDLYGHKKGDDLILATADVFKKCCREEDIVARWGGDEFVLLLPQTSRRKAKTVYQRIKQGCSDTAKPDLPLSLAVGLVVKTKPEQNITALFSEAEKMMYRDKLKARTTNGNP
jgi:diguanylate cyclase (GGDEF)-like protein